MIRKSLLLFITLIYLSGGCTPAGETPLYLDASQPVEKRVNDLMRRMTLEEKVAQMCQYVGMDHMQHAAVSLSPEDLHKSHMMGFYLNLPPDSLEQMIRRGLVGSLLHVITPQEANYVQQLAMESPLRIPVLIGIDAIHGNGLVRGSTIYPTSIGQAASFNTALVQRLAEETAVEMRATGTHWTFNPNVEVARDARWGRVGETFGEDPYLVGEMGRASVIGYQSDDLSAPGKVLACAKHLVGGSQPVNGINGAPFDVSERTLREVFLPPFLACVEAGAYTVMTAHNEYAGVPCHASKFLMTDVLRDEWGFDGFIVSDWMDIERLQDYHRVGETLKEVYKLSVDAGMDMHMHGPEFFYEVVELVREGQIPEKRINDAARKILTAKFELGLFENPYINEEEIGLHIFTQKHRDTALEMARQSIVLLKNDGILPLQTGSYKNILVTGPNAHNQTILGDWAGEQPEENVVTIYQGLQQVSPGTNFSLYEFDWDFRNMTPGQVKEAARMASQNDLAIVVVGENSMRHHWNEKTCGENSDRYDIDLFGLQNELIREIHQTGTPVVVVLVNGRPLSVEWISDNVPALIEAWEPGSFGGQAVAEILYGQVNPSAKLPITIPRHSGQVQTYYNHKFTAKWFDYATGNSTPLYEFGYGLSYTTYAYSGITLSQQEIGVDGVVTASIEVTNTGKCAGEEIVQLYIVDEISSATRPVKELKDFRRIALKPGETKKLSFEIPSSKLAFYDLHMHYGVEPGAFQVMIGSSSKEEDLQKARFYVK